MKRILVAATFGLMLAGCQSQSFDEMSYSDRNKLAREIANRCAAQGYADGHPKQNECIKHEVLREDAVRRNNRARAENARMAVGGALSSYGQGLQQGAANYNATRPMNCTTTPRSTFVGGTSSSYSTSCY